MHCAVMIACKRKHDHAGTMDGTYNASSHVIGSTVDDDNGTVVVGQDMSILDFVESSDVHTLNLQNIRERKSRIILCDDHHTASSQF